MTKFAVGDDLMSLYQGDYFPARCLAVDPHDSLYYMHYLGWNKKWDEWVPEDNLKHATAAQIAGASKHPIPAGKGKTPKRKSIDAGASARGKGKRTPRTPRRQADSDAEEDFHFDVVVDEDDVQMEGRTVYLDEMPILGGEEVIADGTTQQDDDGMMFDMELLQSGEHEEEEPPSPAKKRGRPKKGEQRPTPASTRGGKKGPGRPRRSALVTTTSVIEKTRGSKSRDLAADSSSGSSSDESDEEEEAEVLQPPPKEPPKKRGRKPGPKSASKLGAPTAPVGRKRTRGRSSADDETDTALLSDEAPPPAKRGRPRRSTTASASASATTASAGRRGGKRGAPERRKPSNKAGAAPIDDEAFSAAQELIRLGEVEAPEIGASTYVLPSAEGDVEMTGFVTDFDGAINEVEVEADQSLPFGTPVRQQRRRGRAPRRPKTSPVKSAQVIQSLAQEAAEDGRDPPLIMHDNFVVELPDRLTNAKNKPKMLNSYSLWFKYESRKWNIGDKDALAIAMKEIGSKWRNEVTPEEKEIWRQRARIYNAKLSQDLGIARGPLDLQSLASAQSLAGLGYGLSVETLSAARRRDLLKKKALDPISSKLQWDCYLHKARKTNTNPEPWTLEIGEIAGMFRVMGAALDDVGYRLRHAKMRGRKMYDESTQFTKDMGLQLLLDTLLSACGNLLALTKQIEGLDGASPRDLRHISENAAAFLPVLYQTG